MDGHQSAVASSCIAAISASIGARAAASVMVVLECGLPEVPGNTAERLQLRQTGMDALALWDDDGNGRITCAEARRHGIAPAPRGNPAYRFMHDGDGDGVVCE